MTNIEQNACTADDGKLDTRSAIRSAINDLATRNTNRRKSDLLDYLEMYRTLKPESDDKEKDLLGVLQRMTSGGPVAKGECSVKAASGRYSQVYQLSAPSIDPKKLLVITDSGTKSGQRSLAEYFRRYGQVDHVKIYEGSPLLAVLQFCNAISVDNAVKLQHVIDGHIVTCFPYQNGRVVEAVPWSSGTDAG